MKVAKHICSKGGSIHVGPWAELISPLTGTPYGNFRDIPVVPFRTSMTNMPSSVDLSDAIFLGNMLRRLLLKFSAT